MFIVLKWPRKHIRRVSGIYFVIEHSHNLFRFHLSLINQELYLFWFEIIFHQIRIKNFNFSQTSFCLVTPISFNYYGYLIKILFFYKLILLMICNLFICFNFFKWRKKILFFSIQLQLVSDFLQFLIHFWIILSSFKFWWVKRRLVRIVGICNLLIHVYILFASHL